jgi:hypothetical protein
MGNFGNLINFSVERTARDSLIFDVAYRMGWPRCDSSLLQIWVACVTSRAIKRIARLRKILEELKWHDFLAKGWSSMSVLFFALFQPSGRYFIPFAYISGSLVALVKRASSDAVRLPQWDDSSNPLLDVPYAGHAILTFLTVMELRTWRYITGSPVGHSLMLMIHLIR